MVNNRKSKLFDYKEKKVEMDDVSEVMEHVNEIK